jgi:DNA-binding GntR family transcriptional regulator
VLTSSDEQIYLQLRNAIVREDYHPNERLIETDIAQTLGVGRAAVRSALARLETEGLVERERYRGARVRLISEAEAVEILEVRASLESLAARYAAQQVTPAESDQLFGVIADMERCIAAGDLLGTSELNSQLHATILRISRHRTAIRLLDMLKPQQVRYQYRTILVPGRPEHSLREHRAIVETVTSHDTDRAEQAMRRHLNQVAETLRQVASERRKSEQEAIR